MRDRKAAAVGDAAAAAVWWRCASAAAALDDDDAGDSDREIGGGRVGSAALEPVTAAAAADEEAEAAAPAIEDARDAGCTDCASAGNSMLAARAAGLIIGGSSSGNELCSCSSMYARTSSLRAASSIPTVTVAVSSTVL